MSVFTILVEFVIEPGAMATFLPLMLANARTSLAEEEGCRQFDVLRPEGDGDRIVLYEIYDDRAAFDLHAASAHFRVFDQATASLVRRKTVTILHLCGDAADGAQP